MIYHAVLDLERKINAAKKEMDAERKRAGLLMREQELHSRSPPPPIDLTAAHLVINVEGNLLIVHILL